MQEERKRIVSIDVLRGVDMFWLLCGAMTCRYLFKAWPNPVTEVLSQQSYHVKWFGLSVHDLVFPTFLFRWLIFYWLFLRKIFIRV